MPSQLRREELSLVGVRLVERCLQGRRDLVRLGPSFRLEVRPARVGPSSPAIALSNALDEVQPAERDEHPASAFGDRLFIQTRDQTVNDARVVNALQRSQCARARGGRVTSVEQVQTCCAGLQLDERLNCRVSHDLVFVREHRDDGLSMIRFAEASDCYREFQFRARIIRASSTGRDERQQRGIEFVPTIGGSADRERTQSGVFEGFNDDPGEPEGVSPRTTHGLACVSSGG